MTILRIHQISIISILAILLLAFPWFASAAANFIQQAMWSIVVAFFGFFVGLSGWVLNFGVTDYVVGFGDEFLNSGVGAAVDGLWVAVRDIFNLTFIFGLVYIGFKMILNSDDSNTQRWLKNLILAALLVNFSLYITKFIVDFSNILATQIANTFPTTTTGVIDVSGAFMNSLGITSLLNAGTLNAQAGAAWGVIFGTMILFIVMIFVFAAGGIMLLIRYVALCLYMVLSPLMFLGWVFPQMQSVTSDYWRGFLGRAFFAPLYLLLVYFSWYVVSALYTSQTLAGKAPNFNQTLAVSGGQVVTNFGSTFPPFIISCIFLIASIVIANKLGADGAATAMSYGKSASNWTKRRVQNAAWSTTRAAGRGAAYVPAKAARRGSYALGNSLERQLNKLQEKEGKLGKLARTNGADNLFRGGSEKMKNAKYGLGTTIQEDRTKQASIQNAAKARVEQNELENKSNVAKAGVAIAAAAAAQQGIAEDQREHAAKMREEQKAVLATNVPKLADDKLLAMSHRQLTDIAAHLTDKQVATLEKSGKFSSFGSDSEIEQIKTARNQNTFKDYLTDLEDTSNSANQLSDALKGLADTVKNLSNERLQGLDKSQLTDERVAMNLSGKQLDTLRDSGKFSPSEIKEIRDARTRGLSAVASGNHTSNLNPDSAGTPRSLIGNGSGTMPPNPKFGEMVTKTQQNLMTKSVTDAGELPVEVFIAQDMAQYMTPQILEQRMRNGSISDIQKATIENNIRTHLASGKVTETDRKKWTNWTERSTIGAAFDFSQPAVVTPAPTNPTIDTTTTVSQAINQRNQK